MTDTTDRGQHQDDEYDQDDVPDGNTLVKHDFFPFQSVAAASVLFLFASTVESRFSTNQDIHIIHLFAIDFLYAQANKAGRQKNEKCPAGWYDPILSGNFSARWTR